MSLRVKLLLIAILAVVASVGAMLLVSRTVLERNVALTEDLAVRKDLARARAVVVDDLEGLNRTLTDWAGWDDTYRFVQTRDPAYVTSNLTDDAMANLRLDYLVLLDRSGRMVASKALELESRRAKTLPAGLIAALAPGSPLATHRSTDSSVTGILALPEGPLLVASQPVLTSEREGPVRGTMLMARQLDAAETARLSRLVDLPLSVTTLGQRLTPPDVQQAAARLTADKPTLIVPLSDERIAAYALLGGISTKSAAILRIEEARSFFDLGWSAIRSFLFTLVVVGLIAGSVVIYILNSTVLSRLALVSKQVDDIRAASDISKRLAIPGGDELSALADLINRTLDALERAETERRGADKAYGSELRALASQLSLAEERERRRIAVELHESVGQMLATAKLRLGSLAPGESAERRKELEAIRKLLVSVIRETRSLTSELSLPVLYEVGFEAAVEWLAEQARGRYDLPCEFSDDGQPKPLSDDVRAILFRAVRELLLNVSKHAHATHAKVSLARVGASVMVVVEDDGAGFDPAQASGSKDTSGGFGLFSIRERMSYMGGRLEIRSEGGSGTQVTLLAPLEDAGAAPGRDDA